MELEKWLRRKYPKHHKELLKSYRWMDLNYLKLAKYKVGILIKDNGENKKGDLVIFKLCKEYIENQDAYGGYAQMSGSTWSGSFEYNYIFAKPSDMIHNTSYIKLVK